MKRDERLNLLITKELKENLKKLARFADTSVNDLINCILTAQCRKRIKEIECIDVFDNGTRWGVK